MDNSISFRSRIEFVNGYNFRRNVKYMRNYIPCEGEPLMDNLIHYIKKGAFYTDEIRTCTAGGITDTKSKAIGFHIFDNLINSESLNLRINALEEVLLANPNMRGLLIGGKQIRGRVYSLEIFNKIKEFFCKNIPCMSIFEEHLVGASESHIKYSLDNDKWAICTYFYDDEIKQYKYVESLADLKKAFRNVKIAEGDTLFIGGREISGRQLAEYFKN